MSLTKEDYTAFLGAAPANNDINYHQENEQSAKNTSTYVLSLPKIHEILAEFSTNWIYWLHPDNSIGYISPSCKYTTGYRQEEFIENPDLLRKIIYTKDIDKFERCITELNNGKIISSYEFRIITKTNEVKWIAQTCQAVYDSLNRYTGRYVCNNDITEFKRLSKAKEYSDLRLLNIYDHAELGHYQMYPDGKLKSANKTFLNLLGYESFNDALLENFEQHNLGGSEKRHYIKNMARISGNVKNIETEWFKKDKTPIYIRETLTSVKNNEGTVLYYEGIIKDITEKRYVEISMLETAEHKKQLENLKNEFLATVSHEVRTPLNSIINISQIMRNELAAVLTEDLSEYISIIEKEGKRIQRTIALLLEMSQLVTQTFDFSAGEVDLLNDVLYKIFSEYKEAASSKNINLVLENRTASTIIIADKYSVYQIFVQLVDNAIKYTKKGEILIKIFRNMENNIAVEIIDTGIGIAKEYIPKLFSLFSQEDNSYSRMFEGTGLGLALVKKYCELNNAHIEVESSKGKGSSFRVVFLDTQRPLI